ncbi:uncharacterized protein LOC107267714 [Cephus cinctus]|uniref:Uncharacterized protein LOC107267714 n=1 Tax=Cephus cinctus TaxID=211228 RepID=A0AAJ7BV95_CEPCN|nr:uncharacterized protein LOC107267714 [Cephus cinctus]
MRMLGRRRGGISAARKMAKKNVPAALQTEVSNDEEWAKILERKGLVVVDVFSDWSGPCTGMVSILKKIKMEIGGDTLTYAIAKCDEISDLARFRGKSEPTWMFIYEGRMVNLMFGAHCPELQKMITKELQRIADGGEPEFSLPVSERSPEEEKRLQILEETRLAKEAAKKAKKEAEAKAKYEAEMSHLINSLCLETCLIIYPWVFKDEEGHRRDKKSSPPYMELIEDLLPDNYIVEEQFRKRLDDDILMTLCDESDYVLTEDAKQLLLDGKCMCMRLKINDKKKEMDVEKYLLSLLFGEPILPELGQTFAEGCYAERHHPAFIPSGKENVIFPVIWAPPNPRNKAIMFKTIFRKYIDTTYPYEDKGDKYPIIVFKYDSTKKNDLKIILEMYNSELVNFGVFERDKPPDAKQIASSIEEFEEYSSEKTGYETFVCVVKKISSEVFLTFAGIGPYHVSDCPEKAIEESLLYFPIVGIVDDVQSDDDEKLEELEVEGVVNENGEAVNNLEVR